MSEKLVIQHCSPVLAGMKTGSMFTCFFENKNVLKEEMRRLNRILGKKGIRAISLRYNNQRALIYLYRPSYLLRDLKDQTATRILCERGYCIDKPGSCVAQLIARIGEEAEFPHEIGLFLGYPPEDVCGFIENKADCCKCVGCWKVYGDANKAMKLFAKYKKCTSAYRKQYEKGRSLERLAVAV